MDRRNFLKNSTIASAGTLAASATAFTMLEGCKTAKVTGTALRPGSPGFEQQPLGYKWSGLEPSIDAATMEIHYSKHAAAYAKNMNDAAAAEGINTKTGLELLLSGISKYSSKFRNNAGGHYNHESFWKWMTPGGLQMSNELKTVIESAFGSINDMKNQFTTAATQRFGSGWAWLIFNKSKKLEIGSTPNQDNPLMDVPGLSGFPLLGLDVWEHAYYLKYQNKRADYIAAWWNIVNWQEVEARYNWAIKL